MTPMVTIWITSLVGAVLFLMAGFMLGRIRSMAAARTESGGPSAAEGALFRKATRLETLLAEVTRERDVAQQALLGSGGSETPDDATRYQLLSLETEIKQLKEQGRKQQAREVALQQELQQHRSQSSKKTEGGEIKKLQSEQATLERRRRELELARASLERYKVENNKLRANIRSIEAQKATLEMRLDGVEQELNAAAGAQGNTKRFGVVSTTPITDLQGADLQTCVQRLAGSGTRAAVLADSFGLKVVGTGQETDELAAAAALLADAGSRASRLLPATEVRDVRLTTDPSLVATAYPFSTARGSLVLAVLGQGPGPDRGQLQRAMAQISKLV